MPQLWFGANADPDVDRWREAVDIARMADAAGLDLVEMQDHPYLSRHLDTWTLLATLAPVTERVRLMPGVANLPLRPPAMLAKQVASLDVISDGRAELGLGAGSYWDGIAALGGPRRSPAEAVAAVEEAVAILRLMWGDQRRVRYAGRHYRVEGAHPGPKPRHDVGIYVGAGGRRMLHLLGRVADGWVASEPYVPAEVLDERHAWIDAGAAEAGRPPEAIRRMYNLMGFIGQQRGGDAVSGPVDFWVERIARYALDHRMDTFFFWPTADRLRQLEVYAEQVVPAVRRAVGGGA